MSHESRFWTVNCVETPNSTLSMTLKASSLLVGFTATYFSLFSNSQFFFFFFFWLSARGVMILNSRSVTSNETGVRNWLKSWKAYLFSTTWSYWCSLIQQ
jgi:hypothetical protein